MPNFNIPAFQPATDDLFVYSPQAGTAPAGATTMAQIQTFMRNNSDVLKCLVQRLWQPQVQYVVNQVVWSPNMGPNLWAKVKTAGTTLGTEPVWSELVGAEVTDGTVVYTMCEIVPTLPTVVSDVTVLNGLITIKRTDNSQNSYQFVTKVNNVEPDATGNVSVDGIPVGWVSHHETLLPQHVKANGATVARSDYSRLKTDYVDKYELYYDADDRYMFTGTIASGETTISAISSTEILALKKDYVISGTGIPEGTTITEVGEDYVTISQAATASATESISYGNINNFPFLYGIGDGTSTFVLPDYRGRFIMGGDNCMVQGPGLPDIISPLEPPILMFWQADQNPKTEGAIHTYEDVYSGFSESGGVGRFYQGEFKASYSNSIYGNSETVQPPALVLIPQIKF